MHGGLAKRLQLGGALALAACNAAAPVIPDSGSTRCIIGRVAYASGVVNPADSCQICNPSLQASSWTSQPDLTSCSASDGGTFCQLGRCVNGCGIGGLVILAGASNPSDPCQICAPDEALSAWSANPSCTDGGMPDAGPPDAGTPDAGNDQDAGTCFVGGVTLGAGEPSPTTACQSCQPAVSTTSTSPAVDGTPCDAGGSVCISAVCSPGCYLEGALVAPHKFQSDKQDLCCNPDLSVGGWTAGFLRLVAIPIAGATSIASAAVTTANDQLIVGTSLGGLVLLTELPDGGFTQSAIVSDAGHITAVAAVDVSGDGLVDLLYLASTSPTLLVQNQSHGFGPPRSWPGIQDGGGLWAEETPYGAQVLSFDEGYSAMSPSFMQPQVEASGQILDACPNAVDLCSPTGLAFGSFRLPKQTELVMTCLLPDGDNETLYGEYIPGRCGDGGWMVAQLIPDNFTLGEVYGPVIAAGDLNGDGYSEIVGGGQAEVDLLMNWGLSFRNFGPGGIRIPVAAGGNVTALQIADLRGDAGGTIVAVDTGNSALDVFYPPPPYDAGIDLTGSYSTFAPGSGIAMGDFDGDGRRDVAVLSSSGVQVFQRQCP